MTQKKRKPPQTLKDLSNADLEKVKRSSAKWHKRFAPRVKAIRESARITAEDLSTIFNV